MTEKMNKMRCEEIVAMDKTNLLPDIARDPGDRDSYAAALHCAGVDVVDFMEFGSYQGNWWAEVKFPNGEIYFVTGSYGSCSGCDAFQGEFGWASLNSPDYAHKLRDFGRRYLAACYTKEQALAEVAKDIDWDHEAQEVINWLNSKGAEKENEDDRRDEKDDRVEWRRVPG